MRNAPYIIYMKIMAFYLPQYHEVEENNIWWGKGFTDWTNVKGAKKYFENHRQPRIPMDNWYYDLSEVESIKKQADIAKEYGIYGMCIYHYWFNGKLLLEKPVELILKHPEIGMRYCFSWANESWARTWDGKNNNILIAQEYGGEADWKKHFDYFLNFFKDDRYIKVNNKPMLILYKANSIPNIEEMINYWNKRAIDSGFAGIHVVETLRENKAASNRKCFDARVEFEPARALSMQGFCKIWIARARRYFLLAINKIFGLEILTNKVFSYEDVARISLKTKFEKNTYAGVFLGWDNTPRKKTLGTIIQEPTKEEFRHFLEEKIEKVRKNNDEDNQFLFVNAWNEWAEGTYLEPDSIEGYKYLETIKQVVCEE